MTTKTEQIWEAFHVPLSQFIRRRVSNECVAEDLLQDVFLKIHLHVETLKDVKQLENWLYQIARNTIIDYYRTTKPVVALDTADVLDLPEDLPADDIITELLPSIRAMISNLPPHDRQALILTEYQGLSQKELGARLGISCSGAKSRVQRAREKLKQQLLECCHFELDRRGGIINYQPRCQCCTAREDCAD